MKLTFETNFNHNLTFHHETDKGAAHHQKFLMGPNKATTGAFPSENTGRNKGGGKKHGFDIIM